MAKRRKEIRDVETRLTRRMFLLGGGQLVLGTVLAGRLYQLQIAQGDTYQKLSDRNQFDTRLVPAPRGRVLDRKQRLLVGNSEVFELNIIPARIGDLRQLLGQVARLVTLSDEEITRVLEEVAAKPEFVEITIRSDLTQRELSRLAVRSPALPGVVFQKGFRRLYPQGSLFSHIAGYVSPVTAAEVDEDRLLRRLPGLQTGKVGLEKAQEQALRGEIGVQRLEVNALGKPVRLLNDRLARSGKDIQLTIDLDLQSYAAKRLQQGNSEPVPVSDPAVQQALSRDARLRSHFASGDQLVLRNSKGVLTPPESGAAMVMDVETGAVRAMVSLPGFDPNQFAGRLRERDWQRLNQHPRTPLLNRTIAGLYSPGSTFKMAVLAAALEAGVVTSKTQYFCNGHFEFGDRKFYCWREGGHGAVNGRQAIAQSCDVYFYQVALKTGINRIHALASRLGLGDISGLGLPGEKIGILPTREWKMARRGTVWTPGETVIAGIGQGFVLATPAQLAVMAARIANGKKQVTARLLEADLDAGEAFAPLGINAGILNEIQRSMRLVMAGALGTARNYDLTESQMAGKTGTVQVKRITKAQREEGIIDNLDRPWKERDHALFVGYAPYKKPRYAVSVVVEHGGSGSSMAAPIARDLLDFALRGDRA